MRAQIPIFDERSGSERWRRYGDLLVLNYAIYSLHLTDISTILLRWHGGI